MTASRVWVLEKDGAVTQRRKHEMVCLRALGSTALDRCSLISSVISQTFNCKTHINKINLRAT